jgi:hypothetical protein
MAAVFSGVVPAPPIDPANQIPRGVGARLTERNHRVDGLPGKSVCNAPGKLKQLIPSPRRKGAMHVSGINEPDQLEKKTSPGVRPSERLGYQTELQERLVPRMLGVGETGAGLDVSVLETILMPRLCPTSRNLTRRRKM